MHKPNKLDGKSLPEKKTVEVIEIETVAVPVPVPEEPPVKKKYFGSVLIAVGAFGKYRRGDMITDPDLIEKVLASPQASFVRLRKESK
jgi:hypothetical protein